jgi:hypothetical protein
MHLRRRRAASPPTSPLSPASPQAAYNRSDNWGDIRQFAIKALIVFVLLFATLAYGAIKAKEIADTAVYNIAAKLPDFAAAIGPSLWLKLEAELDRTAALSGKLLEDRRQKLLADLRLLVARLRPFVAEVQPLFAPPEVAPQAQSAAPAAAPAQPAAPAN